jgi:hypothetical protein
MFAKSFDSSAAPRGEVHPNDGAGAAVARTRRVVRLVRARRVRDCASAVPTLEIAGA